MTVKGKKVALSHKKRKPITSGANSTLEQGTRCYCESCHREIALPKGVSNPRFCGECQALSGWTE